MRRVIYAAPVSLFVAFLGLLVAAGNVACSSVHFELHDYQRAKQETEQGTLHFSLVGQYKEFEQDGRMRIEKGEPYYLLVRLVFPERPVGVTHATLTSIQMSSESGANLVLPGSNLSKEVKGPGSDGHMYVSFRLEGLRFEYQDYSVSGQIRLHGDVEQRQVPFSAVLRTKYEKRTGNAWWERLMGI